MPTTRNLRLRTPTTPASRSTAKALLVASAPGAFNAIDIVWIYEDADRGGTDEPLDGEMGLGADESLISGVRRRTATVLQLNDNDNPVSFDISAYFDVGGAGNDLTLYLQTLDGGEVSFPVAGNVDPRNAGQVRFTLPADAQTLLDNLATGDRWIFKAARAATAGTTVANSLPALSTAAARCRRR